MQIRMLTPDDAQQYWELRLRALQECPDAFGSSYEEEKERPLSFAEQRLREASEAPENGFMLGCFDADQRLIGIVGMFREPRKKLRHKAGLNGMYVAPDFRTNGVGRALVEEVLYRARAIPDLEQVNLVVVTTNREARSLYHKCGFATYGIEQNALKLGDRYLDEDLMVCFLHANQSAKREDVQR